MSCRHCSATLTTRSLPGMGCGVTSRGYPISQTLDGTRPAPNSESTVRCTSVMARLRRFSAEQTQRLVFFGNESRISNKQLNRRLAAYRGEPGMDPALVLLAGPRLYDLDPHLRVLRLAHQNPAAGAGRTIALYATTDLDMRKAPTDDRPIRADIAHAKTENRRSCCAHPRVELAGRPDLREVLRRRHSQLWPLRRLRSGPDGSPLCTTAPVTSPVLDAAGKARVTPPRLAVGVCSAHGRTRRSRWRDDARTGAVLQVFLGALAHGAISLTHAGLAFRRLPARRLLCTACRESGFDNPRPRAIDSGLCRRRTG